MNNNQRGGLHPKRPPTAADSSLQYPNFLASWHRKLSYIGTRVLDHMHAGLF